MTLKSYLRNMLLSVSHKQAENCLNNGLVSLHQNVFDVSLNYANVLENYYSLKFVDLCDCKMIQNLITLCNLENIPQKIFKVSVMCQNFFEHALNMIRDL